MSDVSGPAEPVPNELRILASMESLGTLRSVHRPATRLARFALKSARVYLYDQGVVVSNGRGGLGLYCWDQIVVTRQGSSLLLHRADGVTVRLTRHWSEAEALGEAITQGAQKAKPAADGEGRPADGASKPGAAGPESAAGGPIDSARDGAQRSED